MFHVAVAALRFFASALPAQAPSPPPPEDKGIVVVGERLKQVLQNYVAKSTQVGPTGQLARWDREICPKVLGIDATQAEYVRQRIALVAEQAGLHTRKSGCPTMLSIIVTTQVQPIADAVAGDFPDRNWKYREPVRRFLQSPSPVRWVSLADECGGGCSLPNTRLSQATRPRLQAMIILVDSRRLAGVSLGQLSDYLALVALTNPPMGEKHDRRTILGLFDAADMSVAAPELTNVDLAFLTALYQAREEFKAGQQRSSIVSGMTKDLKREGQKSPPRP